MPETRYCKKGNHTVSEKEFYISNNLEKYPDGKLNICKKCACMHVDNWDPNTYLWLLQECDVPYVPDAWNELLAKYGKDPTKLTGLSIIGRYLAKMRLKQFKDFRWKDTQFLQDLAHEKMKKNMEQQGYSLQEITQAIDKATFEISKEALIEPDYDSSAATIANATAPEDYFSIKENENIDLSVNISDEERKAMCLKWGKSYTPEDWVYLEDLYNQMMESYDIQTAAHIDTLKLICKTSLKCNQLIDLGDVESFQKMSKVYDSLMKSGKFTAAQNKAETGEFLDSIGELVAVCEQEGFIPRYYIDKPNDKVDETIKDMQLYTKRLVEEETNLSELLEEAVKSMQKEDNNQTNNSDDDEDYGDDDIAAIEQSLLKTADYEEFDEYLNDQEISDTMLNEMFAVEGNDE